MRGGDGGVMSTKDGRHRAWVIEIPTEWKAKDIRKKLGHRLLSIRLVKSAPPVQSKAEDE